MEHLSLEIFNLEGNRSKYANLPENTSITITDTSEIFASGDVWSYSFKLNIYANAHIFGSAGDLHGSRLHELVNKRRARLWIMGVPIYLGYLKLGDEVEVDEDGNVSVTFESGQGTFRETIEGMNARDVSVGDVRIGIALNRKRPVTNIHVSGNMQIWSIQAGGVIVDDTNRRRTEYLNTEKIPFEFYLSESALTQRWPKLVLSKGTITNKTGYSYYSENIDFTKAKPYDNENPYCNINVCYQKKVLVKEDNTNTTTGESSPSSMRNGNENNGTDGLRGATATTTASEGSEKKVRGYIMRLGRGENTTYGGDGETRYNNSPNFFLIHWLNRLFVDKNIHVEENQMMDIEDLRRVFLANFGCFYEEMDTDNDKVENYTREETDKWQRYGFYDFPTYFVQKFSKYYSDDEDKAAVFDVLVEDNGVKLDNATVDITEISVNSDTNTPTGYIAYATGDNYPDVEASEIINSTEAAFGVRFLFNRDFTAVRIILLRNVFQNNDVQNIECEVTKDEKVENSKRGFILTYGGDEDDTTYNYDDWSRLDTSKLYQEIKDKFVTSFNKTCYYTPNNGNAYRIKIDEDEEVQYYYPVLVEVAGYNDAKDGNCDGDENTIETVTIPAKPLIMNEVDGKYAVFFSGDMKAPGITEIQCQIPTGSIDTTIAINVQIMKSRQEVIPNPGRRRSSGSGDAEYIIQLVTYYEDELHNIHVKAGVAAKEGYIINLQDRYDFSGNDGTPFDKANIGLCFGILRGSGADASINYMQDTAEGEGNDFWEESEGSEIITHPDICDNYGGEWDYNGKGEGIGNREGRFSLKLRAEKPNPNFNKDLPESDSNPRFQTITNPYLRQRGLLDQFYKEYSYWVRNARIVKRTVKIELAQLLAIDKTKRVKIADVTGFIRKIQYSVSNKTGLGLATFEIMYI